MRRLPKAYLIAFILATLLGACLHFLYSLLPNPVTALFSPVSESVWEHLKMIYWPFLLASAILLRKEKGNWPAHLLGLLVSSGLLLLVGWIYHIQLGREDFKFDIGLYVVLMALAFLLGGKLGAGRKLCRWKGILAFLVIVLGAAIVLFSFLPPGCCLFADLSGAATWATIPF